MPHRGKGSGCEGDFEAAVLLGLQTLPLDVVLNRRLVNLENPVALLHVLARHLRTRGRGSSGNLHSAS